MEYTHRFVIVQLDFMQYPRQITNTHTLIFALILGTHL